MNYTQKAIELAMEGVYTNETISANPEKNIMWKAGFVDVPNCFLDPLFWQALGKSLGLKSEIRYGKCSHPDCDGSGCEKPNTGNWKYQWHRFIDHLASGGTPEKFFEGLIDKE